MKEKFNPGICEVQQALIIPYGEVASSPRALDITGLIIKYKILQSISSVAIQGSITCYDKTGYIERLPLRGEEELLFKIKSFDFGTERSITARIVSIGDLNRTPDGNGLVYTMNFISKLSYKANINYLITSFNGLEGDKIVKKIFEKYYSKVRPENEVTPQGSTVFEPGLTQRYRIMDDPQRALYIQPTRGNMRVTIPDYSPSEAMKFICRRSYSDAVGPSSTFNFFETWDGYHFVTDEWMNEKARLNYFVKPIKKLNYFAFTGREPEDSYTQVTTIQSFENNRRVDVSREMFDGAYTNSFTEIDLLRHRVKEYNYKYLQSTKDFIEQNKDNINLNKLKAVNQNFKTSRGNAATVDIDIHTQDFIDETFTENNAKSFMIVRDYTSKETGSGLSKDDTFYRQSTAFKTMYMNHINATQVTITMAGRLDLVPGEIVDITVKENDVGGQPNQNKQLSGKYLIRSVVNIVDKDNLKTVCQICKYDWSDGAGDTSEVF